MPVAPKNVFKDDKEGQARSSVLNPLQWMTGICIGGITSLLAAHAPNWILITLASMLASVFTIFLCAYLFFMLRAPDALRSERYGLTKHEMNLRYGIFGRDETIVAFTRSKSAPSKTTEAGGTTSPTSELVPVPIRFYPEFYTSDWPKLPARVQDALSQFLEQLQTNHLHAELMRQVQNHRDYLAYEFSPKYVVSWRLFADLDGKANSKRIDVLSIRKSTFGKRASEEK